MNDSSKNLTEAGIPAGTWNKYKSKNPIQRFLVNRFLKTLTEKAKPFARPGMSAMDMGCGEGITTGLLKQAGLETIVGYDFSEGILEEARENFPEISFAQKSIYELTEQDAVDFVAACEVLEHLDDPEQGLECLARVCKQVGVFSVPNEPLFRGLNFCAGKYVKDFGNAPGHLNHWSSRAFVQFVQTRFMVESVATPLPWTIVVVRPKP